jgi:hypothetical protein
MLGTNRQFEALIHGLDARIANLERSIVAGTAGSSAATLEGLWARRRSFHLLVLYRRVEAAKPVVDFQTWRDGDGAIDLCTLPTRRSHKRAN